MKIDPPLLPPPGFEPDGTAPRKPDRQSDAADALQPGSDIRIKLSPTLQGIEKTLTSNDINASRVEAIKQALASGQYQISTERIATGLISTALQTMSEGNKK